MGKQLQYGVCVPTAQLNTEQEIVDLVLDRVRKLADNCTGLQVDKI